MRKTIIYLLLLVVLGFGVYYFLFSNRNVFGVNEAGFTVEDTAAVYKIFMADKSGNTIQLERKENGWIVNDKFPAIQTTVAALLKTLNRQQAMYPVAEASHNMVIRSLAAKGIKVELYDKHGDKIKVFYVGGQAGTIAGTHMLMEGAEKVYVVQVPGFEGYLTPRYSVDLKDWRDRTVFDIPQTDLKSVTVQYPDYPLNNFTLTQDDKGNLSVTTESELMKTPFNERRAKVYAKFFEKVYCEGYLNGTMHIDSALTYAPKKCIIDVETKQGKKQHLEIFWMRINQRSKNMDVPQDANTPYGFDVDRYYATTNNFKDTILIQAGTFNKFFRNGYEFFSPDDKHGITPEDTFRKHNIYIPPAK